MDIFSEFFLFLYATFFLKLVDSHKVSSMIFFQIKEVLLIK